MTTLRLDPGRRLNSSVRCPLLHFSQRIQKLDSDSSTTASAGLDTDDIIAPLPHYKCCTKQLWIGVAEPPQHLFCSCDTIAGDFRPLWGIIGRRQSAAKDDTSWRSNPYANNNKFIKDSKREKIDWLTRIVWIAEYSIRLLRVIQLSRFHCIYPIIVKSVKDDVQTCTESGFQKKPTLQMYKV